MKLLLPILAVLGSIVIAEAMTNLDIDKEIQLLEERHEKRPHRPVLRRRQPSRRKPHGGQSALNNSSMGNSGENKKREKVWLNFTEANRQITALIKKRYKKEKDMLKPTKKPNKKIKKEKACHSLATLRCGCETLKSFEEAVRSSQQVPFQTKCDLRGKFFQCLDETSKPPCRHPKKLPQTYYRKHMEDIVRVLWSTRGCLLGGADDVARNSTIIKVDSGFCADLTSPRKSKRDPSKPKRKKTKKNNT